MKLKKITLEAIGAELPPHIQKVYVVDRDKSNDEEILAKLAFDLWKDGIECQCTCEGMNEGEVIVLVDFFPDGECS